MIITEQQPLLIAADHFIDDEQRISLLTGYFDGYSEAKIKVLRALNSRPFADERPFETAEYSIVPEFTRVSDDVGDLIKAAHAAEAALSSMGIPAFVFHVGWKRPVET
jgi:hypothetical protein